MEANGEEAEDASESRFAGELDAREAAAAVECRSSAIASAGGAVRDESGSVPVSACSLRTSLSVRDGSGSAPASISCFDSRSDGCEWPVIPDLGTASRGNKPSPSNLAMEVP